MIVLRTKRGDKALRKLDPSVRAAANAALKAFLTDRSAHGLNFEKLKGHEALYSIRINSNFRIILTRTSVPDTFEIDRIGPHDVYRRLGGDD